MSRIGKIILSKFKTSFNEEGRLERERDHVNSLSSKLSVNEEYFEAFRTRSYMEMLDKLQAQMEKTASSSSKPSSSSSSSSDSTSSKHSKHLSEYLLEPQEKSISIPHPLLVEYFESSLEAYDICEILLRTVHQTHNHYFKLKRILLNREAQYYGPAFRNSLSIISHLQFNEIHSGFLVLLHKLTSTRKKVSRKLRPKTICCSVLNRDGSIDSNSSHGSAVLLVEQLDMAARGVYIMVNDFDTLSRMVRRLEDEVEHRKVIAGMCVDRINGRSVHVVKQVLNEFDAHEDSFLDLLKELEQQIYLCCLTINKSRRLVLQEIMNL